MAVPNSLISPQIAQMMDKIKATHLDDISREVDVAPLLLIVEKTFNPKMQVDVTHAAVQSELSVLIDQVSCEISCKSLSKADSETTTLTIFNMMRTYDWDVKLVLSLAAFALNYGSFQLINRIHSTDKLAESIGKLRYLPNLSCNETLSRLITAMVNLAKCVLEFQRPPRVYISPKFQAFANALKQIQFAAYLTVKSIVTCSVYISSIKSSVATQSTVLGHGFQCMEADLSGCAQQLITTYETLNQHLVDCSSHRVTNKNDEFYQQLVMHFETTTELYTTTTLLTILLCANDTDRRPLDLIQCSSSVSTATTISISELNLVSKNVLMFFSSLEISKVEITNIISVYEKHKADCEIVWIPIIEQWTEAAISKFNSLQALMPWYTIGKPKSLHTVVVNFVKNKWQFGSKPMHVVLDHTGKLWQFGSKPMLVVLDRKGKFCSDAFPMVQIWGADAFPFTISRQKELWRKQTWKLDLLIQSVQTSQPIIWNWITKQKLIFLVGGNNMNEVKEIIQSAVSTKHEFMVVCISNSFTEQQFSSTMYEITQKQDGYCLIGEEQRQLFKLRLESMLFSKMQVGDTAETDTILFGIQKLLSYSKTTEWAMLSQGSEIKVCGIGSLVKQTFHEFSRWRQEAARDFAAAFVSHYQELSKVKLPPSHVEFPPRGPCTPSPLLCPKCNAVMKISTTFSCDHHKYRDTSTSITNMTSSNTSATVALVPSSTGADVVEDTNTGAADIGITISPVDTPTATATTPRATRDGRLGSATSDDSSSDATTNIGHTNPGVDDTSNTAN